ncbi:MAG TPA: dienelactone hydrolase family protein [Acidimicrobiia bacterium]|nr:dienelactone hydrolase family protein [Acidimicrobiia bacterium]
MAVLAHEGIYPIMYGACPIPMGTGHRTGYLARPDTAGRFPVTFVLPSLDGLGSFEKDLCRRLARNGILAISLDFYRQAGDPLDGYNTLSDARAIADLDELHAYVVSDDLEWAVGDEIAMLGVDVGGRFGLISAATRPWVRSLVLAYTPLTGDEDREYQVADFLDHLPVPVLGLYGADDDLVHPSTVDEAQNRNQHGQWLLYPGARHRFLDIDALDYNASASEDAMGRILAFLKETLPPAIEEELG